MRKIFKDQKMQMKEYSGNSEREDRLKENGSSQGARNKTGLEIEKACTQALAKTCCPGSGLAEATAGSHGQRDVWRKVDQAGSN